jgi:hypothetical protein
VRFRNKTFRLGIFRDCNLKAARRDMSERRFVLVDFTHMSRVGYLRLYEAGRAYTLPRAIAHAATKRELVAKQRPPHWMPPSMFRSPEVLTEAEVIDAEAELRALRRHALEVVNPESES